MKLQKMQARKSLRRLSTHSLAKLPHKSQLFSRRDSESAQCGVARDDLDALARIDARVFRGLIRSGNRRSNSRGKFRAIDRSEKCASSTRRKNPDVESR
ncbi:MAG: hypothetical protein KF723_13915 [Rhizobiaceae bacterium]|nr:hypothetical protein [Rhizobiaceae bacterium]